MLTTLFALALTATPPDDLIRQLEDRLRALAPTRDRITYSRVETKTDIRDPRHPVVLERKEYRVRRADGRTRELLIAVNDAPVLNPKEELPETSFDRTLATRFRITNTLPLAAVCNGCYLVSFEPLPLERQPPRHGVIEELLSRVRGHLMIDLDTGVILWLKATLAQPFGARKIGRVHEAEIQMNQQLIHGVPMIVSITARVHYSVLGIFYHQRQLREISYFEFELRPETPSP